MKTETETEPKFIRPMRLARRWGVRPGAIYDGCADGLIPYTRLGMAIMVPMSYVVQFEATPAPRESKPQPEAASKPEPARKKKR